MVLKTKPLAIQQKTIIEVTLTDCPKDVQDEVEQLWRDMGLGNDYYYYKWYPGEDDDMYPIIAKYLSDNGIDEICLIHFWW